MYEDPGVLINGKFMPRTMKASIRVPNPHWIQVGDKYYFSYCTCWH